MHASRLYSWNGQTNHAQLSIYKYICEVTKITSITVKKNIVRSTCLVPTLHKAARELCFFSWENVQLLDIPNLYTIGWWWLQSEFDISMINTIIRPSLRLHRTAPDAAAMRYKLIQFNFQRTDEYRRFTLYTAAYDTPCTYQSLL